MSSNLQGSLPLPGRLDCQCGVTMARLTQDVIANRVWLFAVVHLGTSSLCSRDCNGLHPLLPPFQKLCSFFYLQKIVSKKSNHMRSDTNSDGFKYQTFCIKCIYIQTSMNIQMPRNPIGKCIPSDAASLSGDKMVVWCVRMKVGI